MFFSIISMDLTVNEALLVLLALVLIYLIALTFHEWAHSFVAYKQGDLTPKLAGRLSLNPAKHLSFWGYLCFLLCGIGWGKPVPINPLNFKKYRTGVARVSLAGVGANAILMIISSFCYVMLNNLVGTINTFMWFIILFFRWSMEINAFLIIFNLLPIYPFDGFNFLSAILPSGNRFIEFSVRNSMRIIMTIILVDLFVELFMGISLVGWIISNLAYYLYIPFELLWGVIF